MGSETYAGEPTLSGRIAGTESRRLTTVVWIHTNVRPRSRGQPRKPDSPSLDPGGRVVPDEVGCGCSSVVEHHVANVMVVSSNLITRSIFPLSCPRGGWRPRSAPLQGARALAGRDLQRPRPLWRTTPLADHGLAVARRYVPVVRRTRRPYLGWWCAAAARKRPGVPGRAGSVDDSPGDGLAGPHRDQGVIPERQLRGDALRLPLDQDLVLIARKPVEVRTPMTGEGLESIEGARLVKGLRVEFDRGV